jgi:hypothetical protein
MKYISVIAYISVRGESLMNYIVISQDFKSLRKRLIRHGVRMGIDFVLRQRLKSYVNSTLFLKDINNIFVFYLNEP